MQFLQESQKPETYNVLEDLGTLRRQLSYRPDSFSPDSNSYRGSYFQYGGGGRTLLADWTWHQGAIAGGSGRGAIAGCHCSVLWLEGEGDDQLWGSGRGAIAGCHRTVPL